MTPPDVQSLIGEVAARHGVTLRPDDPAFALVTVNHLVLERAMGELVEAVRSAVAGFEEAAGRVQARAGGALGDEVRRAGAEIRLALRADFQAGPPVAAVPWWRGSWVAAVVGFAVGIVIGVVVGGT